MNSRYKIALLTKVNNKTTREISLLIKQLTNQSPKISLTYLKKVINNKSLKVFIALNKDNKIVGIVTVIFYQKIDGTYKGYVEDLVVDIKERRKGIGEALVKKILKTAKKMGVTTVHLTSNPHRIEANLLYKKLGFKLYKTNYYKYNFED